MGAASSVLVIGAGGLIGRQVAAAFGSRASKTFHLRPVADAQHLDVTNRDAVDVAFERIRPKVVVLAAADPFVERCEREPEATRAVNVEGTLNVQRATARHGALLVVFSSEYVFDGTKGRYTEDDAVAPINEYGRQKVELEAIARLAPRYLICRTSGVYGWEQKRLNFVCQLVDALRAGREFVVPADQLITPTYAPELAGALRQVIDRGVTGTLHLAGPEILPRPAFARIICEVFGLDAELVIPRATRDLGLAAPRPLAAGLADEALRDVLGRPLASPREALARMRSSEERQIADPS